MKITILMLFVNVFFIQAESAYSQQMVPTLSLKNITLEQAFSAIEKKSHFVFLYSEEASAKLNKKVNIQTEGNEPVSEVVAQLLENTELDFLITDRQIAVFKRDNNKTKTNGIAQKAASEPIKVTGVITDEEGIPLPGVTIYLKSNRQIANISNVDGEFIFVVPKLGEVLMFSYMGMNPEELAIKAGTLHYKVTMTSAESQLKEVVVETGIFQRDKTSFTGAASAYTGKELKAIGNQNLIQSLKVLDPSFVVLDNNIMGSDPNTMAKIEVRGQGGSVLNNVKDEFGRDPNAPLFILNGIEVSIERINDLDINRIESVTTLKDAGSTAIYGSKGANGVIVIETIKPKPGELRISYNADLKAGMPDLSVYNMMNAQEKLEFERLSGKYTETNSGNSQANYQKALDELYNYRLAEIRRGVDTYWLSEPVRTGFTHGHSVRVSGGSEFLSVDAGAKYKNDEGVMKGSKRETWGGNLDLTYRNDKIIVSNFLDLSGTDAVKSPYGNFSDWVDASPYFRKRNEDGTIEKFLQYKNGLGSHDSFSSVTQDIPNPLYNALLDSKDYTNSVYISNSLQVQYTPLDGLRFKVGLDLNRTQQKDVQFTPPENTRYHSLSIYQQGEYYNKDSKNISYRGRFDAIFTKLINKHTFGLSTRAQIEQSKADYISTSAEGFPYGSQGTPNLAYSYEPDSKPGYSLSESRAASFKGFFNYDYDKRYLFDSSLSIDGASTFGSNKLFQTFWSTGIGWNINKESFLKDQTWIEILKLRAIMGISGNQNMGRVYSKSVYEYYIDSNIFGQGIHIRNFGNPDLPWLKTKEINVGADVRVFDGRLSLTVDYYQKKDDPNIISMPQIPSTGIKSYPIELGHLLNKGIEFKLVAYPIMNKKERIYWLVSVMGSHNKKTYGGLGDKINSFNAVQRSSNTMNQYRDGHSPDDIWAVRSHGIDPATGSEVYIKKNGALTFDYDADDMVVVGSYRPDLQGVISSVFRYKAFEFGMAFRYSVGSDIYNNVLYNKVENISLSSLEKNQDKRALYDRWKNPGDIAEYQAIQIQGTGVMNPRTSRFVQKNNYLNAESISCKYEIMNNPWLKNNLGIASMIISGYVNDIFRLETSKTERSTAYPFARSVSLGLNLTF